MATVLKSILLAVYLIVCIVVILITTFQNKDNNNPIEDSYENPRFEKNKSRTKTGKLEKNTIIFGIAFGVLSVVTGIVYIIF